MVKIGRERLRQILEREEVTFQRTKTWKESNDPERDAKLDRIEDVLEHRNLDRHGDGWEGMREGVRDDQGWPLYLGRFAAAVDHGG